MAVSKYLVQICLLYDFKVRFSSAASSRRMWQNFVDSDVCRRSARHGRESSLFVVNPVVASHMSLIMKPWRRRHCRTSANTIKTYKLGKCVSHSVSEAKKFISQQRNVSRLDRVLTNYEIWVMYATPKRFRHWLLPRDSVHYTRPPLQSCNILLSIRWTSR